MENTRSWTGRSRIALGILALGALTMAVNLYAQGNSDHQSRPSHEHGDVIHGNPHHGLAGTGGAVVTGNGINYNGGPVMQPVNLYFILYGDWTGQDKTGPAILQTWGQNIAPSPYFAINTTYGDSAGDVVPNLVTFKGVYTDTGSLGMTLSDASIGQLTSNAINSGKLGTAGMADPNGLYMVLTAPGVAESSGFLSSYCGWHWSGSFVNGAVQEGYNYGSGYPMVKFAFIGNATGSSFYSCAVQGTSPNGDAGADAMISVMAHELSEAVSDPEGNAWYASNGEENGDLCAWNFGNASTLPSGAKYNVTINSVNYLMQQIWLNANGGSCALSYAATPDFNVSVSTAQSVTQGNTSGSYTATATPSGGFGGTVTWASAPPSGITLTPTSSNMGNTFTFTLTAAPTLAAGTYNVPITGTSSPSQHSVNAVLTVTAPDFTPSVTGSQSVGQGLTSKNYTLSYTAKNGFTGTVNWAITPPAGITATPANLSGNGVTFTLTATSIAPGTYSIPILATSGTLSHQIIASLTVTAPVPSFNLSISPSSQNVKRPTSGTATASYGVTITPVNGFSGSVKLTASGGTTGVTLSVTSPVNSPYPQATLTVNVTNRAKLQTHKLTVTGSATGVSNTTASTSVTVD